ncbi:hypothetical protein [Gardnerella sp. Marseille-Q2328]|nr:hypothetical protein [Gardnerella sp. Marseille-Q2328]
MFQKNADVATKPGKSATKAEENSGKCSKKPPKQQQTQEILPQMFM